MLRSPLRKSRTRHARPNRGETGRARPGGVGTRRRLNIEGEEATTFSHRFCCGRQTSHRIRDVTKRGFLGLGSVACLIKRRREQP